MNSESDIAEDDNQVVQQTSSPGDDDLREPSEMLERKTWVPRRYLISLLGFLGFANIYAMRVNLSVGIVAMTSNRTIDTSNGTIIIVPDFDWDRETQGTVLSSFFYGYILTQILGGWLACYYGGKRLFGLGVFVTAVVTILTPLVAKLNFYLLVAARIVEGLFEGVTHPAMHGVWSHWAPPAERSRLVTITLSGSYFGTVVALPLSGALAENLGWPWVFYVFGIIALVWTIIWHNAVSETPSVDRHISPSEKHYIEETVGPCSKAMKLVVPWRSIFTSLPVWAIVVAHFSENWGFYTLLTELPTYMNDVFHFNMHNAGIVSAIPYLVMGIIVQSSGFFADWLRAKGNLSTMQVRKLFTCIGFICQSLFMVAAANLVSASAVIATLTIALGFGGFAWSGFSVNPLDIAPQYASILMGISNTAATIPGIISPILTSYLVQDKTAAEWQTIFHISALFSMFGALMYAMLASGKIQNWAVIGQEQSFLSADEHSGTSTEDLLPVPSTRYQSASQK